MLPSFGACINIQNNSFSRFEAVQDFDREAPPSPTLAVKHAPVSDVVQSHKQSAIGQHVPTLPATISFSTTTATTSFMSDTSNTTKASQSTAATSICGQDTSTQQTDYLASSWASRIDDLEQHRTYELDRIRFQLGLGLNTQLFRGTLHQAQHLQIPRSTNCTAKGSCT